MAKILDWAVQIANEGEEAIRANDDPALIEVFERAYVSDRTNQLLIMFGCRGLYRGDLEKRVRKWRELAEKFEHPIYTATKVFAVGAIKIALAALLVVLIMRGLS